jgi:hypothetical protein
MGTEQSPEPERNNVLLFVQTSFAGQGNIRKEDERWKTSSHMAP